MIANREIKKISHENKVLGEVCEGYKGMVQHSHNHIDILFGGWNMTTDLLKTTATSLVNSRKRLQEWSEQNGFAIMIKNCPVEQLPYYAIRCRNENMEPALKKFKSRYPDSREVFGTQLVPNGVNLFHKLKELPNAKFHQNHYNLPCSEGELREKLITMCYGE